MRDHVRFFLNGQERVIRGHVAFATLAEYLRWNLGLCGTKVVCAEGDCGACTVLAGRPSDRQLRYVPIDACVQFVFQVDGAHIISIEGMAANGELHDVQKAMVDCHGSQCGYCTPGIVMALAGWTEAGANPSQSRIALTGNLCRCTGYTAIFEAASQLLKSPSASITSRFDSPHLVQVSRELRGEAIRLVADDRLYYAPTRLSDAIQFKAAHPDAEIVAGATELGVLRNKRGHEPRHLLSLGRITELDAINVTTESLTFAANVTWSQIEKPIRDHLPAFLPIVVRFGSPQIRHAATVVGNIANGSPIADCLPLFCILDAELEIAGPAGTRHRSINGFYTGYKQKDLRADELITRVTIPLPDDYERLRCYKISRRNDLDISTFCAAIRLTIDGETIVSACIAYGGVAATVVRLPETERYLVGRRFEESTFRGAGRLARNEVTPIADVRGSAEFRLQLCENVLRKFYFDEVETLAEAVA